MDFKTAYPYREVEKEIYIRQLEGYDNGLGRVCRLRKRLYGLKQSGCQWNMKLNTKMANLGLQ